MLGLLDVFDINSFWLVIFLCFFKFGEGLGKQDATCLQLFSKKKMGSSFLLSFLKRI